MRFLPPPFARTRFRVGARAVCSAAAFLLGVSPALASGNNVPDWVRDAAHQALPTYPPTTKAVVLLSDTTYTVGPDGRAIEHVRQVIKILRPQGRDEAYPFVPYDKDSKVTSFHVWSIDKDGHEYAMKDSEYLDIGHPGEGGNLYDDERARVANPPGRDPGGVIAYEYDKKMRPYLAETSWFFQGDTPRLQQRFRLVLPPGYTYTTSWAHHPPVSGADLENHSYVWEMNNESAIDLDHVPLAPASYSLASRMTVHYAGPNMLHPQDGTWTGVGQWYTELSRDRLEPSPEIAAKAAELTQGKTDFYDKAEAIAVFMQQHIRYWVVEQGIGGLQPHFASEVFKGGYGDCKDKATLLSALLKSVGIHSTLVLVDTTRGFIDPDDPSIKGNHAIAAIEIPKGYTSPKLHSVVTLKSGRRYVIFDPTWTETPFGQIERNLQGGYAVLVEGPESELVHLPVMPPELNTIRRSASFTLLADGTLKGAVTEKRFGDVAESRRVLATQGDAKEQQQRIDRAVARDFAAVSVTGLNFADASTLSKEVVTKYDLEADHFATATGPLLILRPRVLGSYQLSLDRKPRKVGIDLQQTMQGHDEFDIVLPEGYAVDELPDPVKLDWGFASYESRTEVHGNVLHYARTYTLKEVTLGAARYRELQDMTAAIGADEQSQVVLKRTATTSSPAASQTVSSSAPLTTASNHAQ